MPRFICLACRTRLRSEESEADPVGDLCPVCGSLWERVGDFGEIVRYRVVETRGGTSHSLASVAGPLIAGRVGEITARFPLQRARVWLESRRCDPDSVTPQVESRLLSGSPHR